MHYKPVYDTIVYMSDYNNSITPVVNQSIEDKLLHNRVIWLKDEVTDKTVNEAINKILILHAEDPNADIYMYISSPGGSITAGMGLYDIYNFVSNDIVTFGIGMCASMGQFLLSSGTPGKRFILPSTRVLMHQPSGGISGVESDVRIEADLINDMKAKMAQLTSEQTGHTVEEILNDNEYDHWYTAEQALDYGFIDHIVTTEQEMKAFLDDKDGISRIQNAYELRKKKLNAGADNDADNNASKTPARRTTTRRTTRRRTAKEPEKNK